MRLRGYGRKRLHATRMEAKGSKIRRNGKLLLGASACFGSAGKSQEADLVWYWRDLGSNSLAPKNGTCLCSVDSFAPGVYMSGFTIPGMLPGTRRRTGICIVRDRALCPPICASTRNINATIRKEPADEGWSACAEQIDQPARY